MGTATRALVIVALLASTARADECTGSDEDGRFPTCFDLGNRLTVTGGTSGFGAGASLRHEITFDDDPDLEWKMEHQLLQSTYTLRLDAPDRFTGTFYAGRFLRHSRDGHLMIPLGGGAPKKLFLPFDVGAVFEIGSLDWQHYAQTFNLGVVRVAPLVDFARSKKYNQIFAIGPSMHWDMQVDRTFQAINQQTIAPFTEALAMIHLESEDGLMLAEIRAEAGTAWRSGSGFHPEARASAELEWVAIALNDHPVALTAGAQYDSTRSETIAQVGLKFVVLDRTDPRVSLRHLAAR